MAKFDVVIKTPYMGGGDDSLGENLMKGYIHTLSTKETLPAHIIFYGEGVKLACTGSESIDDLKVLAGKGVKILSCGICLDFFELKEELQVGGVTTMSEVVDITSNSGYIFEP